MQNEKKSLSPYTIAIALAVLFTVSAYVYKSYVLTSSTPERSLLTVQAPDTAHTHTSLLIMIGDKAVNFCRKQYMLQSPSAHFEDNDCYVVHKHSAGVTLLTFFKTIGVELSPSCITTPDDGKHCTNETDVLRVMLNGKEIPVEELTYYELRNNDHILINFGPEKDALLRMKYNLVPLIPLNVNNPKPIEL